MTTSPVAPTPCPDCASRAPNQGGVFNYRCLGCCVAHVLYVLRDRKVQEAILGSIARCEGSPSREAILAKVKEIREKQKAIHDC